jgi:hypothetical protein
VPDDELADYLSGPPRNDHPELHQFPDWGERGHPYAQPMPWLAETEAGRRMQDVAAGSQLTLAGFLRARLDEDKVAAPNVHAFAALESMPGVGCACGWPGRVLREVEVWRRLLLEYATVGLDAAYKGTERETGYHLALSMALKAKAATYDDHPDYRQDW